MLSERYTLKNNFLFLCQKDLKYIYGRYINPSSEPERNMYVNMHTGAFFPFLYLP